MLKHPFIKVGLQWLVSLVTLLFLLRAFLIHWDNFITVTLQGSDYLIIALSLLMTTLAFTWSGWVWGWILGVLHHPVPARWSVPVYLVTNLGKYLPGNIWQYVGRVQSAFAIGIPRPVAAVSVILEPLLMLAAAAVWVLISRMSGPISLIGCLGILLMLHPRILNRILKRIPSQNNSEQKDRDQQRPIRLRQYPWLPFLGEVGFIGLRGLGFLTVIIPLGLPVQWIQVPSLIGSFAFAWAAGLVVPGAPGGLGVFETTLLVVLESDYPTGILLRCVALYRVVSMTSEVVGAAGGYIVQIQDPVSRIDRS